LPVEIPAITVSLHRGTGVIRAVSIHPDMSRSGLNRFL
jgi:hypothetical protein